MNSEENNGTFMAPPVDSSAPFQPSADNVHPADIYSRYETGLRELLLRMGHDHPRYAEALVYQQRLVENIAQSRLYGEADASKAERAKIIDRLNELTLSELQLPFSELCDPISISGVPTGSLDRKKLLLEPIPTIPHFVGRSAELAAYQRKLRRDRFVIIVGMSGVGKTTMGAKLAREEAEREEQIFWFTFDAVEKNTVDALFWSLAAFLDSRGQPNLWRYLEGEIGTQQPLDRAAKLRLLRDGLSSGDYLLCFDDFQIVKDVADVTSFFKLVQQLFLHQLRSRLIIMGREIPPEMEYLVSESLEGFTQEEARLFVEAQHLQLPAELLQRLWSRTEGNAKMLELSVSHLSAMDGNLVAIGGFIESMARLKGDLRDYVMAEIYAILQPDERKILGALSIFPTLVEREMVEVILDREGVAELATHIDALVNKHIVNEMEDGRIHCHSLVREYCYHILARRDRERFHQRAANYYDLNGSYLSSAHHHFERGDHRQALDMLTAHAQDIINAGDAGALLEQTSRFQRQQLNPEQWVMLCQIKGDAHNIKGEYPQALETYEAALAEVTREETRAELLGKIGFTYRALWQYELAMKYFMESLDISAALGDQAGMANAHREIAWASYRLGQMEQAREHFTISQGLGQALGSNLIFAKAQLGLGAVDLEEGRLDEARSRFEESQRIFRAFGERRREAMAVVNLGLIYRAKGDQKRELSCYRQAMEIQEQIGDVEALRVTFNNLGDLYFRMRDYTLAIDYYNRLARLAEHTNHTRMLSWAFSRLADTHRAIGDLPRALEHAQTAQRMAQNIGPGVELGVSCRALGDVWLALGDLLQAKKSFEQSIPFLEKAKEDEDLAQAHAGLALVLDRLRTEGLARKEEDHHEPDDPDPHKPEGDVE